MPWLVVLLLVAIPRLALAEPKVALAPLDDDDGKIAEIVGEAVSENAKLTKPARVENAMKSMGVSVLSPKSIKKLRARLDVDVVIYGSVERDGSTKRVLLLFGGSSTRRPKLDIEASTPKQLRKELAAKLAKRIDAAMEGGDDDDDEEDERAKREEERKARVEEDRRRKEAEEERKREEERKAREEERKREEEKRRKKEEEEAARKKKRDDDERRARRDDDDDRRSRRDRDDDRRAGRDDEEARGAFRGQKAKGGEDDDGDRRKKKKDDERKKRVADEDDEDDDGGRARKRLGDEDDEDTDEDRPRKKRKKERRHVLTQAALWLDGGASFNRRTLTYSATGMMAPPPVGTASPAGRLAGEVYPAAFSTLRGSAAAIGISGMYSRTFGLGIKVPGTQITTPITMGHYAIGARYRFAFGQHSLALGVSYWRRYFMADRSQLMTADQLDMPDVDYSAIAPGAALRVAATPKISVFATFDVPLMLYSGPIQRPDSYGSAKILAFDLQAGTQIMVASRAALQIALDFDQIGLAFTGQAGSKASTRMVSAATDRTVGLSATIGITY